MNAPWALAISARLRERRGIGTQVVHSDDGIVVRLPFATAPVCLPGFAGSYTEVSDSRMMNAVAEHTTIVSTKTPSDWIRPCLAGCEVSAFCGQIWSDAVTSKGGVGCDASQTRRFRTAASWARR